MNINSFKIGYGVFGVIALNKSLWTSSLLAIGILATADIDTATLEYEDHRSF